VLSEDIREIQIMRRLEYDELSAEREMLQMELSDLKKKIVLLECAVKTKQECIDCCDAEIAGLKAVIHYIQSESQATGARIGFLMQQNAITPDGSDC
jgi:chromosome segregation ATPase